MASQYKLNRVDRDHFKYWVEHLPLLPAEALQDPTGRGVYPWQGFVIKKLPMPLGFEELQVMYCLQQPPRIERMAHVERIQIKDDFLFLAMKRLPFSLQEALTDPSLEAKLDKWTITRDLIAILQEVHNRGICHGDIKPENLLLDDKFRVHFCDWGISVPLGFVLEDDLYTPPYRPPELWLLQQSPARWQMDTWALGSVIFELFTGVPFTRINSVDPYHQQSLIQSGLSLAIRQLTTTDDLQPRRSSRAFQPLTTRFTLIRRCLPQWYEANFCDAAQVDLLPLGIRYLLTGMLTYQSHRRPLSDLYWLCQQWRPVAGFPLFTDDFLETGIAHPYWVPAIHSSQFRAHVTRLPVIQKQDVKRDGWLPVVWQDWVYRQQSIPEEEVATARCGREEDDLLCHEDWCELELVPCG